MCCGLTLARKYRKSFDIGVFLLHQLQTLNNNICSYLCLLQHGNLLDFSGYMVYYSEVIRCILNQSWLSTVNLCIVLSSVKLVYLVLCVHVYGFFSPSGFDASNIFLLVLPIYFWVMLWLTRSKTPYFCT